MKNYILLMISFIVLSKTGFSQTPIDSSAAKPATPDVKTLQLEADKKNELSIDLIPLIKMASISQGRFDMKGTIQYKRQLKSQLFLRFGVTVMQQWQDREFTNIYVNPADNTYDMVSYLGTQHKPELHLNTGLEFRWGKRRIRQFAGIDLGYLRKATEYTNYRAYVPRYSNYDPNNYAHAPYHGPDSTALYSNNLTQVTGSHTTVANGIAITPFYGMQYHFSRRFFFSMQLGVPLQILWYHNVNVNRPSFYSNYKYTEFNFGEGGILNNFSLGFRF
jgi:hypothetical protein